MAASSACLYTLHRGAFTCTCRIDRVAGGQMHLSENGGKFMLLYLAQQLRNVKH